MRDSWVWMHEMTSLKCKKNMLKAFWNELKYLIALNWVEIFLKLLWKKKSTENFISMNKQQE